jgi:hypothetical protein
MAELPFHQDTSEASIAGTSRRCKVPTGCPTATSNPALPTDGPSTPSKPRQVRPPVHADGIAAWLATCNRI